MMIGIAHDKPAAAQSPKAELIPLRQAISSTDFNIGLRFGLDIAVVVVVPPISADMSQRAGTRRRMAGVIGSRG
jgi:hypothetical protein